jgi:hypothetical protein
MAKLDKIAEAMRKAQEKAKAEASTAGAPKITPLHTP